MPKKNNICHLCGKRVAHKTSNPLDKLAMEHVPPKQFFPKEIRKRENLNLLLLPAHKGCNESYREDEEYFYHCMYPLVQKANSSMGLTIYQDLARRSHKPQTPAMIRRILKTVSTTTDGGLHLPPGIVQFKTDEFRIQRVVLKIARGLLYVETGAYFPIENAKDIRICERKEEVPEKYRLIWRGSASGKYPKIFSYNYLEMDNWHMLTMLFWEAFMFCVTFQEKKNG